MTTYGYISAFAVLLSECLFYNQKAFNCGILTKSSGFCTICGASKAAEDRELNCFLKE